MDTTNLKIQYRFTCSRHILGYLAQKASLTATHRDFPGSN